MIPSAVASPSIASFPSEVLSHILQYLFHSDLAQCALVCKDWHTTSIVIFWRSIEIMEPSSFFRFQSPAMQDALLRNAHLINHFETRYPKAAMWIAQACESIPNVSICQNLIRLQLYDGGYPPDPFQQRLPGVTAPDPSEYQDRIVCLIKSNIRLKFLDLRDIFTDYDNQLSIFSANQLPLLQVLRLQSRYDPNNTNARGCPITQPRIARKFFEDLSENICRLNIDISIRHTESSHDDVTICRKHPRLDPFCIRGELAGQEEYIFLQFLQSCSRTLHILDMPGQVHLASDTLYQCIESHWLHDGLNLEGCSQMSDDTIAKMICRHSACWGEIVIPRQHLCGDLTAMAIADHCQEMWSLNIIECGQISSAALHTILCNAPSLYELRALESDLYPAWPGDNPKLHAADISSSPWTCLKLSVLHVEIVVPRPDVTVRLDGPPVAGPLHPGSIEDSRDLQRRVLAQLGALTELEDLRLGWCWHESYRPDRDNIYDEAFGGHRSVTSEFQLACLEMSLDSGLDLLASLKKLRVVDLTCMMHRVGIAELEWIQENWPDLRELHGLFDDWYPPRSHCESGW